MSFAGKQPVNKDCVCSKLSANKQVWPYERKSIIYAVDYKLKSNCPSGISTADLFYIGKRSGKTSPRKLALFMSYCDLSFYTSIGQNLCFFGKTKLNKTWCILLTKDA